MEPKEEPQIPPPHHQLLSSAKIEVVSGNYAKAVELCSEVLKRSSADVSQGMLLHARQIRFEALQKLQARKARRAPGLQKKSEAQRLLISDAFALALENGTHPAAHAILYKHFMSTKDEPCRALYHHDQDKSSHLLMDVFPGVYSLLHDAAETYSGRQSLLIKEVFSTCETHFEWIFKLEQREKRKLQMMAEMRAALDLLKKVTGINVPIGDFAYSACLLIFSDFFNQNQDATSSSIKEADVTSAIEKLEEIAGDRAPPHLPRDPRTSLDNQRIGYAQFLMGLLYEHGRLVKRSYSQAETWFQKAALGHNMGTAAFHLGKLYFTGAEGIPKNIELAKSYLEQAVASRTAIAASTLAVIYLQQLELGAGITLLHDVFEARGREEQTNGMFAPQYMERMQGRVFNCVIKFEDKLDILKRVIEKIELDFNLPSKGLTFLDRVKRAELLGLKFNLASIIDMVEVMLELQPGPLPDWICKQGDERGGAGGTAYSRQVAEVREGFQSVYERTTSGQDLGTDDVVGISKTLRHCFENSPSLKLGLYLCRYYDSPTRDKLKNKMNSLLDNPLLSDSHLTFRFLCAMLDYFTRVESGIGPGRWCWVENFKLMQVPQLLEALPEFPDDPLYYIWAGELEHVPDCPAILKRTMDGLVRGVEKFPTNVALRAALADSQFRWYSMHMDEVGTECADTTCNPFKCRWKHPESPYPFDPLKSIVDTIQSSREILRLAPVDHPLVPVSAYTLAWATARLLIDIQPATEFELGPLWTLLRDSGGQGTREELYREVARAYTQGVVSESKQLDCFPQTAGCAHMKRRVELFMNQNSTHFPRRKLKQIEDRKHVFGKAYLMSPLRIFSVTGLRFRLQPDCQLSRAVSVNYKRQSLKVFMAKVKASVPEFVEDPYTLRRLHSPLTSGITLAPVHVKLTVIDDVYFGPEYVHVLTEDEEGRTIFVLISDKCSIARVDTKLTLEFGTTLTVANVLYDVSGEEPAVILLEHVLNLEKVVLQAIQSGGGKVESKVETKLILTGKIKNMCRFCGAPDSTVECETCKRMYCSAECLQKDIKFMNHDYICKKKSL